MVCTQNCAKLGNAAKLVVNKAFVPNYHYASVDQVFVMLHSVD